MKKGLGLVVALMLFGAVVMVNGTGLGAQGMPLVSVGPSYSFPTATIDPSKTAALDAAVTISDSNLKATLQGALGLTAQSSIRRSDLAKLSGGLDLSGKSIKKIEGLQYCVNVTDLKLSNNAITDSGVPSSLSTLTNLKTLLLDGNKLTKVPASVLSMTGLTYLSLADNDIKTVPDGIDKMAALVNLDLSGNQLKALPINIGKLQKLQYLNLSGNKFVDVTKEIFLIPVLQTLDLSNNSVLEEIPSDIARMPALTTLNVEGNILSALPQGLGNAPSLQKVYAARNRLTEIEPTLLNGKITDLTLDVNRLTALPVGLSGKTFNTFSVEWNFIDMSEGTESRQVADSVIAPAGKTYLRQLKGVTDIQTKSSIKTVLLQWQPLTDGTDGDSSWTVSKYQVYQVNGESWKSKADLDRLAGQYVVTGLDAEKTYQFQVGVEYSLTLGSTKTNTRFFTPVEVKTLSSTATAEPATVEPTDTPEVAETTPDTSSAATSPLEQTGVPANTAPKGGSAGLTVAIIIICALLVIGLLAFMAIRMSRRSQRY